MPKRECIKSMIAVNQDESWSFPRFYLSCVNLNFSLLQTTCSPRNLTRKEEERGLHLMHDQDQKPPKCSDAPNLSHYGSVIKQANPILIATLFTGD